MTSVPSGVPTAPPTRPLFPATIIPTCVENATPITPQNQHRTDLSEVLQRIKRKVVSWFHVAQSVVSDKLKRKYLPHPAIRGYTTFTCTLPLHRTYLDWKRTTWCRQPRTFTVSDMCQHQQHTVSSAQSRVGLLQTAACERSHTWVLWCTELLFYNRMRIFTLAWRSTLR